MSRPAAVLGAIGALLLATAAAAQAPAFRHEVIAAPEQPGAIELPIGPLPSDRREEWFLQNGAIGVRNVVQPTLLPVLPSGPSTGAAVIVAPGGGFLGLAIDAEGWQVARWFAERGIAAFVLKYRVLPTPTAPERFEDEFNRMRRGEKVSFANPADTPPEALADALAALEFVRANAARFRIDPDRVGFMGFSAGGFVTRSVLQSAGERMPAFAAPIYPNMRAIAVPANAPPLFVLIAADDFLLKRDGLGLVQSWLESGKPVEFHLLGDGGHGFGLGRPGTASEGWIELLHRWLARNGLLTAH